MMASQLEQRVLHAIELLRAGQPVEDDVVEFKRDWPAIDKARQLAGAANRARGSDLIYVVGVDERDGSVHSLSDTDAASWFASLEAAFDEVAPEIERHLLVSVSETERVVAIQFKTDRPPYVVRVKEGGATEREVPLRVGTRTRSANRHELLRLLLPEVRVPTIAAIRSTLISGHSSYAEEYTDDSVELSFQSELYFEHLGERSVFLPAHAMTAQLVGKGITHEARLFYARAETLAPHGPNRREDGIELLGSGSVWVHATWNLEGLLLPELVSVAEWSIVLRLQVAGSERAARTDLRAFGVRRYFQFPEGQHPDADEEPEQWEWQVA